MDEQKIKDISCLVVAGILVFGSIVGPHLSNKVRHELARPLTPQEQKRVDDAKALAEGLQQERKAEQYYRDLRKSQGR